MCIVMITTDFNTTAVNKYIVLFCVLFVCECVLYFFLFFFFNDTATTEIYTLSLHDALPIWAWLCWGRFCTGSLRPSEFVARSEEHTSELQSRRDLVCRLLLEKKKKNHL